VTATAGLLRDLRSRNGTLVNGRLCEDERLLEEGDLVQIGPLVFKVHLDPETPTEPSPLPRPLTLQPENGGAAAGEPTLDSTARHPILKDPDAPK
jgi:pSer/pThr/pTyr-binding forkhead associated (FHA) protein